MKNAASPAFDTFIPRISEDFSATHETQVETVNFGIFNFVEFSPSKLLVR